MPPNSNAAEKSLLNVSMRRAGSSGVGSTTPLALQRSEFEDFMNAYRPNLEVPRRELEPAKPVEESRVDFGRSIKKLMKRPQGSPSVQNKSHRKEGIQRTPTLHPTSGDQQEWERSISSDAKPMSEKKQKRPLSANIETTLLQQQTPVALTPPSPDSNPVWSDVPPPPTIQLPLTSPVTKNPKTSLKVPKNEPVNNELLRVVPEGGVPAALSVLTHVPPAAPSNPSQVKKKVSIQEERRRSATEFSNALCLIISGYNIGRFLPPRHNPDPILNMRVIPIPERKYHVILEFEESPEPPKMPLSTSGLMVVEAEDTGPLCSREQMHLFSWIRESHVASMGVLLTNVEKITEFPVVTYLVVNGGITELAQKLNCVENKPVSERLRQLQFLAGYEETITIARPPPTTFPEKPTSDKTGFVISLYQVLPGDDGVRFEQNWVMWTGARQLYRTVPEYMGLRRMSVHKSVLSTKVINYCLICEFSNIMDHLTDACVIIDLLRARCCGFTGIYRIMDTI